MGAGQGWKTRRRTQHTQVSYNHRSSLPVAVVRNSDCTGEFPRPLKQMDDKTSSEILISLDWGIAQFSTLLKKTPSGSSNEQLWLRTTDP